MIAEPVPGLPGQKEADDLAEIEDFLAALGEEQPWQGGVEDELLRAGGAAVVDIGVLR
eukprot:SAG22_NODE_1252_length_5005_cov_1.761313_2_plen_58_part_00